MAESAASSERGWVLFALWVGFLVALAGAAIALGIAVKQSNGNPAFWYRTAAGLFIVAFMLLLGSSVVTFRRRQRRNRQHAPEGRSAETTESLADTRVGELSGKFKSRAERFAARSEIEK